MPTDRVLAAGVVAATAPTVAVGLSALPIPAFTAVVHLQARMLPIPATRIGRWVFLAAVSTPLSSATPRQTSVVAALLLIDNCSVCAVSVDVRSHRPILKPLFSVPTKTATQSPGDTVWVTAVV